MKKSLLIGAAVGLLLSAGLATAQWEPFVKARTAVFGKAEIDTLTVNESISVPDITLSDDLTVAGDLAVTGDVTVTDDLTADDIKGNLVRGEAPTAQVLAAGGTIAADACGGVKRISSASAVTTDTTNTFTAPAAANKGCILYIKNVNASDAITLDVNALFEAQDGANVALAAGGTIIVGSDGAKWYQFAAAIDPTA